MRTMKFMHRLPTTAGLAIATWLGIPSVSAASACVVETEGTCLIRSSDLSNPNQSHRIHTSRPVKANTLTIAPGYTVIAYSGLNATGNRLLLQASPSRQARLGWATDTGFRWLWAKKSDPNADRDPPTAVFNVPANAQVFSPIACAPEGGACTVAPNTPVAFGTGKNFTVLEKSGTFQCSTLEFGDPAHGLRKQCFPMAGSATARHQVEDLDRGVVAVREGGGLFVGWRLLATDAPATQFNVYHSRHSNGAGRTLLTPTPIADATHLKLESTPFQTGFFTVVPVLNGNEQSDGTQTVRPWMDSFLEIDTSPPAGRLGGSKYAVRDASVGDLDGDGDYELIVKWEPDNARDNSQPGITDNTYIDAYKLNGQRLWRIDLGRNIRSGAHYTPMMVYDFDGDGRAELAMRTSDGTVDGRGGVIGNPNEDHANDSGYILTGPEYLTIFRGSDGRRIAQTEFKPSRGDRSNGKWFHSWGDDYGNRIDRFLGGVAYLDGSRPSLIMARGYYARSVIGAWDLRQDAQGRYTLSQRWIFDTHDENLIPGRVRGQPPLSEDQNPAIRHPGYTTMGSHSLAIADVDFDGKDDIVYGAMVIRSDGQPRYTTGLGHGDALQVGDFNPSRPGLEVMSVHEDPARHKGRGLVLRDARTGQILWTRGDCTGRPENVGDVGRGIVMDIDPRSPGAESWSNAHAYVGAGGRDAFPGSGDSDREASCKVIPAGIPLFGLHWDGDLLREIWGSGQNVEKFKWWEGTGPRVSSKGTYGVFNPSPGEPLRTYQGTNQAGAPLLVADILGDWREEFLLYSSTHQKLRLYTTTIPVDARQLESESERPVPRLVTLMHDPQYRVAVAGQNSAYNQQPNPSFYLGNGMSPPARRPVTAVPGR